MGKVLSSLYRSPAGKLPVVIPKGRIRPVSALIAAKFAIECYKEVKNHVLVRSHWRKYKGDTRLLSVYYQRVGVSIYRRPFSPCNVYIKLLISEISILMHALPCH